MGSAKRRIALVVGVAMLGLFVAPAQGGQRSGPLAHAACDVAPCTVPDNITAPPEGSAIETLPIPAAVGAVIVVKPFQPKPNPGSCHELALNVGVQVTRAGRGYNVQTTGLLKPARGLPGVKVSCRRLRTGPGYQISVTPVRRGQKLARALGPNMKIGFENGSNRSVPVHTAVAFR
jgi:hypothetical protein